MTDDDGRKASLAALKADIYEGLADLAAGRVNSFDPARIRERGRKLLAARNELATVEGIEAGLRDMETGRMVSYEQAVAEIQAVIDAARRGKT